MAGRHEGTVMVANFSLDHELADVLKALLVAIPASIAAIYGIKNRNAIRRGSRRIMRKLNNGEPTESMSIEDSLLTTSDNILNRNDMRLNPQERRVMAKILARARKAKAAKARQAKKSKKR